MHYLVSQPQLEGHTLRRAMPEDAARNLERAPVCDRNKFLDSFDLPRLP